MSFIFLSQWNLGLQLYVASSGIIRHTMNALYSDLTVRVAKLVINSPPTLCSSSPGKRKINRDKSFRVRQIVVGNSRVTGKSNEWEMCVEFLSLRSKCISPRCTENPHTHSLQPLGLFTNILLTPSYLHLMQPFTTPSE